MKLVISSKYTNGFIKISVIPKLVRKIILGINKKKLINMSNILNVNLLNVIKLALKNIIIIDAGSSKIITFSNTVKYENKDLFYWLNLITYGTLSIQGDPFILNAFKSMKGVK